MQLLERRRIVHLYRVAVIAGLLIGVAAGSWSSCDGEYCDNDVTGCIKLGSSFRVTCCMTPTGGGTKHCFSCTRDVYQCPAFQFLPGPPRNCADQGTTCQ